MLRLRIHSGDVTGQSAASALRRLAPHFAGVNAAERYLQGRSARASTSPASLKAICDDEARPSRFVAYFEQLIDVRTMLLPLSLCSSCRQELEDDDVKDLVSLRSREGGDRARHRLVFART
jgi:hypothetical protein